MQKHTFHEFLDKKAREGKRQLGIISKVLSKGGLKVTDFVEKHEGEPYLFLHNPEGGSSFHGVRIYQIGDGIAFRVQREAKTHPYGTAYSLKIPDMFTDLVEDMKEEEAGKKVMESICKEMRRFFVLSDKADSEIGSFGILPGDSLGGLLLQSPGVDLARTVGSSS